jgi:hypothetical protein
MSALKRLSPQQRALLGIVREGRVQYGHEHQAMARRGRSTYPVWLIDGYAAHGHQGRTLTSLESWGLIVVRHDLIPCKWVDAYTKTSRNMLGDLRVVTIPGHPEPKDAGWRTTVETTPTGDATP